MSALPKGWIKTQLESIANVEMGQSPPGSATNTDQIGFPLVGGASDFQDGQIIPSRYTSKPTKISQVGDLILCIRATIGKLATSKGELCLGRGVAGLRPLAIDPSLLAYFLQHEVDALNEAGTGTTFRQIDKATLSNWPVPLPPLAEQRRIVAKLDSLFARTRRTRAELERIPPLVEHYKQAILAAAFRGDLTKDWRSRTHPLSITGNISGIDGRSGALPTLPDLWSWNNIAAVSQVNGGLTKNAMRRDLAERVPYLRVANVYANELRLDDVQEIGCTTAELKRTKLETGDLLVVEGNGSLEQIGRVALWDGSIGLCSHQNHLIRVRAGDSITPQYLLYWMLSPLGRHYIEQIASSSSGLHTLSISKVSGLPVPLCSQPEMQVIVETIKHAWRWIERLLEDYSKATKLLERLDESLLCNAFRGELVSQDPNDEPASALLERIKAVRSDKGKAQQLKIEGF
jgi:type I restriction enzyme S subunit